MWTGETLLLFAGEGPCGLIICPSRELARQTYEVILGYTSQLEAAGQPQLHTLLCIGGIDMKEQTDKFKHAGVFACPASQQLALLACPLRPTTSVACQSGASMCAFATLHQTFSAILVSCKWLMQVTNNPNKHSGNDLVSDWDVAVHTS